MTKLFGVIGDPIAHSLSPLIHKGWMRDYKLGADYLALQVVAGIFDEALETLEGKGFKGLNITLPHKISALKFAGELSSRAEKIGAVNTLCRKEDGLWHGDNTDAPGFQHALAHAFRGLQIERFLSQHALIIGAGGAARSVAYTFGDDQQRAIFCNRTVERAQALKPVFDAAYVPVEGNKGRRVCSFENLHAELKTCAFVINTTSLGHAGASLDWPPGRGRLVYDLSYGKVAENFLGPARVAGWQTVDGLRMLVAQAASSFKIWFGIEPDIDTALERCQRVLEAA